MILIVGLGNIGPQYENTRHNIGFMVVDQLAGGEQWQVEESRQAYTLKMQLEGQPVMLAKPTTMMNLSGQSVSRLAQYYRIAPEEIWVVHDELDIPLGRVKIATSSSENGHNGLISITESLGHNRYWRFKVGVDTRLHREIPGSDYVLQPFEPGQEALRDQSIRQAAAAIRSALSDGLELAMQRYNRSAAPAD